jgi:hypothetical protein
MLIQCQCQVTSCLFIDWIVRWIYCEIPYSAFQPYAPLYKQCPAWLREQGQGQKSVCVQWGTHFYQRFSRQSFGSVGVEDWLQRGMRRKCLEEGKVGCRHREQWGCCTSKGKCGGLAFLILFLFLYFFFGETGVWTQGFVLAKQVVYHLSHTSGSFCSGHFGDRVSRSILGGGGKWHK